MCFGGCPQCVVAVVLGVFLLLFLVCFCCCPWCVLAVVLGVFLLLSLAWLQEAVDLNGGLPLLVLAVDEIQVL